MATSGGGWRRWAFVGAALVAWVAAPALVLADDEPAPPQHVKSLRERILEIQAGRGILEKAANHSTAFVGPDLGDREKAIQVLSRLTFGASPEQIDEVAERGWQFWVKEQLDPDKIDDSECETIVGQRFPFVKMPIENLEAEYGDEGNKKNKNRNAQNSIHAMLPQLVLMRAVLSKRQFKEVMCEFWRNHFCVDQPAIGEGKSRTWTDADYEENVVRKYAFGSFHDMLMASAHHPAMLEYLDNKLSKRGEWNENYAREVMELHTLGADRGYGNRDVSELSKALTGWRYDDSYHFKFDPSWHQPGPKFWLGMTLLDGYAGGTMALETLAGHRNTSEFISGKLCKFLVNDNPSPMLVGKIAAVFRETHGNLPKVYAAILTSPEFMSRENYRSKFKAPFFFTVSALRATQAKIDNLVDTVARIRRMGEPIYDCPDPTGYRDVAESWMDAGVLTTRWQFAWDLLRGEVKGVTVSDDFLARYKAAKPDEVEGQMLEDLIGGDVGDRELAALKDVAAAKDIPRMASIILGSPSFQQR